jgi:hypothetical protein
MHTVLQTKAYKYARSVAWPQLSPASSSVSPPLEQRQPLHAPPLDAHKQTRIRTCAGTREVRSALRHRDSDGTRGAAACGPASIAYAQRNCRSEAPRQQEAAARCAWQRPRNFGGGERTGNAAAHQGCDDLAGVSVFPPPPPSLSLDISSLSSFFKTVLANSSSSANIHRMRNAQPHVI